MSMFIKRTHSKNYSYLSIAETYRENGKVKHRILLPLGREDKLAADGILQALVDSIARVTKVSAKCESEYCFKFMKELGRYNWGAVRVYKELWDKLGLGSVIGRACGRKRRVFDLSSVVFGIVVQRLMRPSSKLKVYERQGSYLGIKGMRLEELYRAMDYLAEGKEEIEYELFERQKDLFHYELDIVLYDITTLYFESTKIDGLRDFGFSKDGKSCQVQVMLGLLVNMDGFPVGFDLFAGNKYEGHTLVEGLKKLKERFRIRHVIVVADRGINNGENLRKIKEAGFDYIVGSRFGGCG